jgi:hypothetical protein
MTRESKKVGQVPILPHIGTYSLFIGYSQLLRQNELPSMREKLCGVAVLFKNRLSQQGSKLQIAGEAELPWGRGLECGDMGSALSVDALV